MLTLESQLTVPGLTGAEITDFFHTCTDERYQAWWPGVHLHLHQLTAGGSDHVGDVWLSSSGHGMCAWPVRSWRPNRAVKSFGRSRRAASAYRCD